MNNDYRCYLTIITHFVIHKKTDEIYEYYIRLTQGDKKIKENHINFVSRLYNILLKQKYTRFTEGFRGSVIQCLEKIISDYGLIKKKKNKGLRKTKTLIKMIVDSDDQDDSDDSDMHISYFLDK